MRDGASRVRAILFDLDGTLINTTELILRCFDHSWRSVLGCENTRQSLIETFGMPLKDAMVRLLAAREPNGKKVNDDRLVGRLLAEYRSFNLSNHDALASGFDGVNGVMIELRGRGYRTGVVTSKSRELATRGLRLCGLESLIDTAVFLEDTARHKPGPEPILAALDRLKTAPFEAAYVGDSCHDIVAGRAAGVVTVAALWGPFPRTALECERPDFLAESVEELLEIFPRL
jgi:pyrophosphatase PpaX